MSPSDAQWRWFLQRSMQRRMRQVEEERQNAVNITVVGQNENDRPRETARVRHVLPSPG